MASINKNGNYNGIPGGFRRGNPISIDPTQLWYSFDEMQAYASSDPTAYVGQIVTLVDETKGVVAAYMITSGNGDLVKFAATIVDEEDGDLTSAVAALQTRVGAIEAKLKDVNFSAFAKKGEIVYEDLAQALKELIDGKASVATTLAGYGITDAYTKTEVDNKISGLFHFKGTVNYYSELTSKTDMVAGEVYVVKYAGTNGTTPLNAEYAYDGANWVEFGSVVDLSGYVDSNTYNTKIEELEGAIEDAESNAVADAKTETENQIKALKDGDIADIKTAINNINDETSGILATAKNYTDGEIDKVESTISGINTTLENLQKADTDNLAAAKKHTDDQISTVNEEINTLKQASNNHVDKTQVASTSALGLVKSSAGANKVSVDAEGTMTVESIDGNKINGSVASADKLAAEKTISVAGDVTGSATFDGSKDATITTTLSDTGVAAGTYSKVTVDSKGRVTSGSNITTTDVGGAGNIITHNVSEFATAAQGTTADSALQSINIAGTTLNKANNEVTKDTLKTSLGFIEKSDNVVFDNAVKAPATQSTDEATVLTTKGYVDNEITSKIAASNAMVYKGTLGTDGTITTLPTTNVKNGDTYKVITEGTYADQQAFVGDIFIAVVTTGETTSISWTLIPSGDDGNVSAVDNLIDGQVIIGSGNKSIKTLANGSNSQVLGVADNTLGFIDQKTSVIATSDEITATATTTGSETSYSLTINEVSTNKLIQGDTILVLDGGLPNGTYTTV